MFNHAAATEALLNAAGKVSGRDATVGVS